MFTYKDYEVLERLVAREIRKQTNRKKVIDLPGRDAREFKIMKLEELLDKLKKEKEFLYGPTQPRERQETEQSLPPDWEINQASGKSRISPL